MGRSGALRGRRSASLALRHAKWTALVDLITHVRLSEGSMLAIGSCGCLGELEERCRLGISSCVQRGWLAARTDRRAGLARLLGVRHPRSAISHAPSWEAGALCGGCATGAITSVDALMVGKFPEGIDPALIHLTGTIVTWWARIEGLLVFDLLSLRKLPDNAAYVAKERFPLSSGNLIRQWSRLQRRFSDADPARLEKLRKLADELREVAEDRNVLVHYFWPYGSSDPTTLQLQTIKPQKGNEEVLEIRSAEITIQKLDSVNERMVRLYHALMVESLNLVLSINRILGPPQGRNGGGQEWSR